MTEFEHLIYEQLLELYIFDLEVEVLSEKLKKIPYKVTCSTGPTEERKYSEEHDAWYDPIRNEWVESKCSDPTCEYCANRPERPL